MASRRLAISSLLCEGDDSERPRSRDDGDKLNYASRSPLPAAAPPRSLQGDRHDEPSTSTSTTFAFAAHDTRRIPVDDHREPGPDALASGPRHQALTTRSITPLPLALQPAVVQHRTPSPPSMSLPQSPEEQDVGDVEYYDDDDGRVPSSSVNPYSRSFRDYPPAAVTHNAYATHTTTPYSQYSSPPSSSSGLAVDSSLGRPSLPVSSFRFSPPVPRRPLPIESTHEYVQTQPPVYHATHAISQTERVANVHPGMEQGSSRRTSLSVNTRDAFDGRYFHAGMSQSPIQPRPPPSAGLSGLDALVQAATEERERIDEHRRRSGGSDGRQPPTRDDRSFAGHTQSPLSAGSSRTQRLSPEWRARPLQPQGHYHGFNEVPLAEQPRTIYNYAAQDARSTKRQGSTSNVSPTVESDAKLMLTSAIHRSQQISPHEHPYDHPRISTSPMNVGATLTDLHVAAGLEELSLARSFPSQPQPSPVHAHAQYQSADESMPRQRRASGHSVPTSVPGPSSGRRTPPRSKPKTKPGSAALHAVETKPSRELVADLGSQEHRKQAHSSRKAHRHEIQTDDVESEGTAKAMKSYAPSKRVSSGRSAKRDDLEGDERDAHDFFLSVFDSPRQGANRQPEPDGSVSHPSKHAREQHAPSHYLSSSRRQESDMDDDLVNAARGSSYEEPANEGDFEEDLADAVADSEYETGEERGDIPSDFADAMDVDVEDELLSLVEPAHSEAMHTSQDAHHHSRGFGSLSKEIDPRHQDHGRLSPETRDRLSMPPPTTTKGGKGGKASKADSSSKHTAPAKATSSNKEAKQAKKSVPKVEEAKVTKAKSAPKPKPKASSEKLKSSKHVSETTEVENSGPVTTSNMSVPPTPVEDPFPTVTSSGRMVKKSIASTLAAQSAAVSSKKRASAATASTHAEGSTPRSRSHSVMPRASVDPETDKQSKADETKEDEEAADEDDKLYCICRTRYDEDRVMIACDRCDEWYHTQCVKMPDLQVDLVDQFICPTCVKRNPGLHLKTTYKQRCFTGLKHPKPNSADACHKPARGAFSKYCSDECGVKYMHMKLQIWTNKGGDVERLWENVKDAKRREGVVVKEPGRTLPKKILAELSNVAPPANGDAEMQMNVDQPIKVQENGISPVSRQKIDSLEAQLRKVVSEREDRKKEMEVVEWRQRLLSLAIARADRVGECGWDQRLCFGDEEWREFGEGVLESYEDVSDGMEVDEQESEWWCRGEKKCERHAGWQKLRDRELNNEREERNDVLVQLTTREREIRNRIEDILHPKTEGDIATTPKLPLMVNSLNIMNGKEEGGKKKKKGGR